MSHNPGKSLFGTIICTVFLVVAVFTIFATVADAQSNFYVDRGCSGCHGATPTTCNGCHHHGPTNLAASTNKAAYAPGEALTVTFTGGRSSGATVGGGWIRAILYLNSVEIARSSGTGSPPRGGASFPITFNTTAPTTPGTYTYQAAWFGNTNDSGSTHGEQRVSTNSFTVTAPQAPTISTASPLPAGTVGTAYNQTLAATGGTTPYSWAVSAGSLPGGLSLNSSTGAITGTPNAAGTYNFTIRVTGTTSASSTKAFALTINQVASPTISTASPLPAGTVGTAYNRTLAATGGTTPYSWAVSAGILPGGLSLNSSTGAITGTPTAEGAFDFTVQVTGADSASSTKAFALTIHAMDAPMISTATPLPAGMVGMPYSQMLSAAGGTAPYSWSVSSGTLPAGLSLNAATGAITGTPTASGTSEVTIQVTGADSASSTEALSLTINAAGAAAPAESGGGGCAIARSGGGIGEIAGAYGFLILTVLGMAIRRCGKRREE